MMDGMNPAHRGAAGPEGRGPGRFPVRPAAPPAISLAATLLLADAAFGQPRTERVEHEIEIAENTRISVMNFSGQVEIRGTEPGADGLLRVVGVKRLEADLPDEEAERVLGAVDLDLRRHGRNLHIGPRRPRSGARDPDRRARRMREEPPITEIRTPSRIPPVSVDLEVWLPVIASLDVRTFSAPIVFTGFRAPDADVRLRSISGTLEVGALECRDLRAETVSGDLRLTDVRAERGAFRTLAAGIVLGGDLAPDGLYDIQTHSGTVTLGLDAIPAFSVAATSYIGEIHAGLELDGEGNTHRFEGRRGDGGPHLEVNTFSGAIHFAGDDEQVTPQECAP